MMISLLQKLFPTTVDRSTRASNPGNLQINYWKYFRSFPEEMQKPFKLLSWWLFFFVTVNLGYWMVGRFVVDEISVSQPNAGLVCLLLGLGLNVVFLVGLWKTLVIFGVWFKCISGHVSFGRINPAIVVSQSPPLVAVATDLRKWDESYPMIKILEQPLDRLPGGVPSVGTRLAAVSLYYEGKEHLPHWVDFEPIVVNCVTDAQADIDRVFHSLRLEDWQALQDGLSCVRRRDQPGLYFVNSSERHVLPEGAEHEEDFAAIGELKFLDIRDVLRVDYQMGNVLRLHRGFPSARSAWDYARVRQSGGNISGVAAAIIVLILGILLKLITLLLDLFSQQTNVALGIGLFLLVATPLVIICPGIIDFVIQPFAQAWEFDLNSGTLTVTTRRVFLRDRSMVYPLSQFHNIDILHQKKDEVTQYSLALKRAVQPEFLGLKLQGENFGLGTIACSEHPEIEQRLEVARQVRFTVRRFMDWLIV